MIFLLYFSIFRPQAMPMPHAHPFLRFSRTIRFDFLLYSINSCKFQDLLNFIEDFKHEVNIVVKGLTHFTNLRPQKITICLQIPVISTLEIWMELLKLRYAPLLFFLIFLQFFI